MNEILERRLWPPGTAAAAAVHVYMYVCLTSVTLCLLQKTKPRRKNGHVVDKGGELEVTLQWSNAPAFYMEECLDKKDKYEADAFFEMYEVLRVERGGL